MLESNWVLLLMIFLFGGIANSIYLTCHHYRTNILHPPTKSFCVISETIDCDRVATSFGSKLWAFQWPLWACLHTSFSYSTY